MSDDLISRLRISGWELQDEAADEIERLRAALAAEQGKRCGNCFWRGGIADMATSEWSGSYGDGCRNRESACFGRTWPADHGCPSWRQKE